MTEEIDKGENPFRYTEEAKQEIIAYLKGAEFGSPKYMAFFDIVRSEDLQDTLIDLGDELLEARKKENANHEAEEPDPDEWMRVKPIHRESRLRITEGEIALHHQAIETKKQTVAGYHDAHNTLNSMLDRWGETLADESSHQFQGDDKAHIEFLGEQHQKFHKETETMLRHQPANQNS
jgi:hypothetical protein